MPKAVLFMPFDPSRHDYFKVQAEYGQGKLDKNKKVKQFLESKGFTTSIVWYDGKPNAHISSLDTGAIYIRGHGMSGYPSIFGAKNGGENVTSSVVIERLIESGLPKTFQGEIHCYNCHSAESGTVTKDDPYAVQFANELFGKGYKSCSYFGYLGPLDSFSKEGSQGENIYSREKTVQVVDGKRKEVLLELGTWDQARVTIHPRIVIDSPVKVSLRQRLKSKLSRH